jgi:hypothetical protein
VRSTSRIAFIASRRARAVGAVVPVLTYAFLASIWFMKVCADQMH